MTDVNTWLALAAPGHTQHRAARQWFDSLGEGEAVFCRVTQMGLLRLLTNQVVMKTDVLSTGQAWRVYEELRSDWRVTFASEPAGLEAVWIGLMTAYPSAVKAWTDAYLAAFAMGYGYTLVTFDRAFRKWTELLLHTLE